MCFVDVHKALTCCWSWRLSFRPAAAADPVIIFPFCPFSTAVPCGPAGCAPLSLAPVGPWSWVSGCVREPGLGDWEDPVYRSLPQWGHSDGGTWCLSTLPACPSPLLYITFINYYLHINVLSCCYGYNMKLN